MKIIQKTVNWLDDFQQRHRALNFGVRVIKKYSDDEGGKLAALITYYAFLSLFPLLLAVTTGLKIFLKNHDALRARIAEGVGHYFPVISNDLQTNVHSLHKTGIALVIALVLTIYGARGGADAVRSALNSIWRVPKDHQPGFPASVLASLKLIVFGGGGMVAAAVLSSYAAGLSHFAGFRVLSIALGLFLLICVFYGTFILVLHPVARDRKALLTSAVAAAVGVEILQTLGGYLLTHELKNLTSYYSNFAIVLGLLFWISLQTQVLLLAAEAGSVRKHQ